MSEPKLATKVKTLVSFASSISAAAQELDLEVNEFVGTVHRIFQYGQITVESTMSGYAMAQQLVYVNYEDVE